MFEAEESYFGNPEGGSHELPVSSKRDEAAAAYTVPEQFKGYTAPAPRVKSDVQVIYDELKK